MINMAKEHREEYLALTGQEKNVVSEETARGPRQHTLFHSLTASSLPEDEKRPKRMAHDGFEILLAGSDTTARSMGIATYHIIANPEINQRLLEELRTVMPNPRNKVELKALENLPFLVSRQIMFLLGRTV